MGNYNSFKSDRIYIGDGKMNMTLEIFRDLTFVLLLIYTFLETRIYLTLWVAILYLIIGCTTFFSSDIMLNKIIIATYVILVGASYLFVFRNILSGKEIPGNNSKWNNLSKDKNKQRRLGIVALIWVIINIAAIFC